MAGVQWNASAFKAGLLSTVTSIKVGVEKEEERLAQLVVSQANVPVDTGTLKASGFAEGNEFGWTEDYAAFVEYGTNDTPAFGFARESEQRAAGQLKSPI